MTNFTVAFKPADAGVNKVEHGRFISSVRRRSALERMLAMRSEVGVSRRDPLQGGSQRPALFVPIELAFVQHA